MYVAPPAAGSADQRSRVSEKFQTQLSQIRSNIDEIDIIPIFAMASTLGSGERYLRRLLFHTAANLGLESKNSSQHNQNKKAHRNG